MQFARELYEFFREYVLHFDQHLDQIAGDLGPWLYLILFLIVFCETGLVVTPFLPGDSLLFGVGALAARGTISLPLLVVLLSIAAILGDAVNYAIGYRVGPKVFSRETSRLFNKKHLFRAQRFYEKYGGKTIFLARFVPLIRTFAPFVAGIGKMRYTRFALFNFTGGIVWVSLFLLLGYFFGNIAVVKQNFFWVIVAIIFISLVPVAVEFWRARRDAKLAPAAVGSIPDDEAKRSG